MTNAVATKVVAKRVADFRGLRVACIGCHTDVHKGELSATCESCHSTSTFGVTTYRHLRSPEFFGGQHTTVACSGCHLENTRAPAAAKARPVALNVRFGGTSTTCASCHKDVHLGQVGRECQSCHSVQSTNFGVVGFSHAATTFPLTGKHTKAACSLCHQSATGMFPAGAGTAVRLKGVAAECRACHQDVHLGQVEHRCESCHSTDAFSIDNYRHRDTRLRDFFIGRHVTARCAGCHLAVTRDFPAGRGTAMAFTIDARCTACHRDEHNGALPDCMRCHRP
jgi:hypothetical protein